jgi:tetratricopeptide (TPR) repeat protein
VLALAPVCLIGLFAFQTAQAAAIWGDRELLYGTWEIEHRDSLRAKRVLAQHYEMTGRSDDALKLLRETERLHPHDLAVPVKMLNIACRHDREPIHGIAAIRERASTARITDGLLPNLEELADTVADEACGITPAELSELLSRVEAMPDFGAKGKIAARILWLHAEVETERRQLDSTVRLLEQAFHYQPTVAVALKRAVILASAGLYQESLAALDQAAAADRDRPFLSPSRRPELKLLRTILEGNVKRRQNTQSEKNSTPAYE